MGSSLLLVAGIDGSSTAPITQSKRTPHNAWVDTKRGGLLHRRNCTGPHMSRESESMAAAAAQLSKTPPQPMLSFLQGCGNGLSRASHHAQTTIVRGNLPETSPKVVNARGCGKQLAARSATHIAGMQDSHKCNAVRIRAVAQHGEQGLPRVRACIHRHVSIIRSGPLVELQHSTPSTGWPSQAVESGTDGQAKQ